jgi:hypothetical protein
MEDGGWKMEDGAPRPITNNHFSIPNYQSSANHASRGGNWELGICNWYIDAPF